MNKPEKPSKVIIIPRPPVAGSAESAPQNAPAEAPASIPDTATPSGSAIPAEPADEEEEAGDH